MKTGKFLFMVLFFTISIKALGTQANLLPNEKLLRLSLEVMLYNKDLKHAFEIARKGVKTFPREIYWQEQAAQIAIWRGEREVAQKYYMRLFQQTHTVKYKEILQRLSQVTGDKKALMQLYENDLYVAFDNLEVEKLYLLYYDLGYLERGNTFFTNLQKRYPAKKVLFQKTLLLRFEYQSFSQIQKAYHTFNQKFGTDKKLLYRYVKSLFSQKKYHEAFKEMQLYETLLENCDQALYNLYSNLAYILHDEASLYTLLSSMYANNILPKTKKELFLRLLEKNDFHKAVLVAQKMYKTDPSESRFYRVLYLAMQQNDFVRIHSLLKTMHPDLKKRVSKTSRYWVIKAHVAQHFKERKKTFRFYQKALKLDPMNQNIHKSYLWSLIGMQNHAALHKELSFLAKCPQLYKVIPFAITLGYFSIQNSKEAKHYIKKMLREKPDNWQLQLLYTDILSLGGEREAASYYLSKAWKGAQKEAKKSHICQKNFGKCYDYIRLGIHFEPTRLQKYLTMGKRLLKPQALFDLYTAKLISLHADEKIRYLMWRYRLQNPATELYLAMQDNDRERISELLEKNSFPMLDTLTAYQKTGACTAYETTLFKAVQTNPENGDLVNSFATHLTSTRATFQATLSYENRGSLTTKEATIHYRKALPKNLFAGFSVNSIKLKKDHTTTERNKFSLSLYTTLKDKKYSFEVGIGSDTKNYTFLKTSLGYSKGKLSLDGKLSLRERDNTTSYTLLHGFKDEATIQLGYRLNRYENTSFEFGGSCHRLEEKKELATHGTFAQLQYTRYLRYSYPDLYGQLFTTVQNYHKGNGKLPADYWQTGINLGAGMQIKEQFHHNWKSYTNTTLLYNNRTGIGYSTIVGTGKRLFRHDYLGIEVLYANGMAKYQENYFRISFRYLFW